MIYDMAPPSGTDKLLDKALNNMIRIDVIYKNGTTADKRAIIGSIFTEKLTFDGSQYRTARVNSVVEYIYQINNNLQESKNGKSEEEFHLSRQVPGAGIELFVYPIEYLTVKILKSSKASLLPLPDFRVISV